MFEWTPRKATIFQIVGTVLSPVILYFYHSLTDVMIILFFTLLNPLMATVAHHRLFVHSVYKCNRFWHYVLGYLSCLSMTSSPLQWAAIHMTHHKYADTDKDPHGLKSKLFGVGNYGKFDYELSRVKRLARDPLQLRLHKYYLLVIASFLALCFLIGGHQLMLTAWFIPATVTLWLGAFHNGRAHQNGEPVNMHYLFGFLFFGEHLHKDHHKSPKEVNYAKNPGEIDLGYQFIRMIRSTE